jgi:hypothetical protein
MSSPQPSDTGFRVSRRKTVEFAFRDINKPMGVATYKTSSELPKEYRGLLPEPETLLKLM